MDQLQDFGTPVKRLSKKGHRKNGHWKKGHIQKGHLLKGLFQKGQQKGQLKCHFQILGHLTKQLATYKEAMYLKGHM